MYAWSLFSLAFVSILDGFGKFTYLIGGIQLYKLSFKEGEEGGVIIVPFKYVVCLGELVVLA